MTELKGQGVLITGASRGLGKALAVWYWRASREP